MNIIHTVRELKEKLVSLRLQGKSVGYVPTMGALHAGHLSLVQQCLKNNDICIVTIFVNPTQFNNKEDLIKYPRNLEQDCFLLEKLNPNIIVFAPPVEEVYPENDTRQFDFGQLDKVMEGKFRPGHFNGVAQVVSRFFEIIKPKKAYFGEKDFQQLAIIRQMVTQLNLPTQIIGMPIVREKDGLAMSSRNERLTEKQRSIATNISKTLFQSIGWMDQLSVAETIEKVITTINSIEGLEVEYFEIVNANTLQSITDWAQCSCIVGCIAVFCGDVRLIDNVTYKAKC